MTCENHDRTAGSQIVEAESAGVISAKEAAEVRDYHDKVQFLLSVDDFSPDELARSTTGNAPVVPDMKPDTVAIVSTHEPDSSGRKKKAKKKPAKKSDGKKAGNKRTSVKKAGKKKKKKSS